MAASERIVVLLFSILREKLGSDCLHVEIGDFITGEALLNSLCQEHPQMAPWRSFIRLAVNGEYEPETIRIERGDEVALITPVSGG